MNIVLQNLFFPSKLSKSVIFVETFTKINNKKQVMSNQQQQNKEQAMISRKTILRRMANTLGGDVPLSAVPKPVTTNPLLRRDWDNAAENSDPPVWLKPSSSPFRKPSIFFSREPVTQENAPPGSIVVPASVLGRAVPLFKVTSQTCEYFALRLPLLKAGFKRIADADSAIDANIMWGKSWPITSTSKKILGLPANNNNNDVDTNNNDQQNQQQLLASEGIFKRPIHRFQKVNHFSGSHKNLGCKSGMARNLAKLAEQYEERLLEELRNRKSNVEENDDSNNNNNNDVDDDTDENSNDFSNFKSMSTAELEQHYNDVAKNNNNPISNFTPETYRLPEQANQVKKALQDSDESTPWIVKPSRGSCGRGIRVFKKGDEEVDSLVSQACALAPFSPSTARFPLHVVQQYIRRPLLVNERKFDFRVYVCVTSYDPLVAYIHHSGLVRFAAKKYDTTEKDITDVYSHLTNYSVGRKLEAEGKEALKKKHIEEQQNQNQQNDDDDDDDNNNGTTSDNKNNNKVHPSVLAKNMSQEAAANFSLELKWSMEKFNDYLSKTFGGKEACDKVWTDIEDVIVKTLFAVQPQIYRSSVMVEGNHDASIELYGFDVMLDEQLKPWLIEVNTLPSLESSSAFDYNVKSNVVTDILNLAQLQLYDRSSEVFSQFGLAEEVIKPPAADLLGGTHSGNSSKKNNKDIAVIHQVSELFDPKAKLPKSNAAAATSFVGKKLDAHDDCVDAVCRVRDEISLMGGFRLMFPTPGKVERLSKLSVPALANSPRTVALWNEVKRDPKYFFNANKLNFPKMEGAVATLQPENDDGDEMMVTSD